jgi:hypothetical protein
VGDLEVTSIGAGGSVTGVLPTAKTPDRFFNSTGYTTTASGVATSGGSGTGATVGITAGFVATITDQGWGPGFEKFLVTAATGNNWSGIVRGFAGTQPIAHCQAGSCSGSTGTFNPGPYPLLPSYITDSAGNIWTLLNRSQTEYTDENTVPLADYSMTFTSITAAAANGNATACGTGPCDTITYTMPYSLLSDISLNVARYRGLGAISSLNNPQPTNGYAANDCLVSCPGPGGVTHPTLFNTSMATNAAVPTSTGPGWSGVSSGDICIAFAGGSPFMPVNGENPLIYPQGVTGGTVSVVNGTSTVTYVSGPNFNSSYSPGVTSVVYNMWTPGSSVVIGGTPFHFATTPTSAMGTFTTVETIGLATATYSYSVPNGGSTQNPSAGWKLAVGDQARVLETYAVATGTSCNGGGYVTHGVDGMATLGAAYHPAGGSTTVYGQSAKIGATGSLSNTSIPALNTSMGKGSVDFEIDNLSTANNATFLSLSNLGFNLLLVQLGGGSYEIGGGNSNLTGGSCQGSPYGFIISNVASVGGNLPVYGRYQVDFSVKTDWFELWDGTGARIYSAFCNWASVTGSTSNGVSLGGLTSPDTMQFGFLWQRSTILPMNSKMPTFAHAGSPNCVYDWHFDTSTGNTTDSCAGTYPLTASGTVSYVNTASTVQSLIKAVPVQFGSQSTSVSGWSTMNSAIGSQQMDCLAQSIIEYNATDVPASCAWTQTQGPTLTGMPASTTQPTISGIVATNTSSNQDYILSLTVTDLESPPVTSGAGTIEMGAAALDANGVVTNITGNAGQFFGPLMSYGNIPWGETDNLHFQMVALQAAYQGAGHIYRDWATYPAAGGTISFLFSPYGQYYGTTPTTITSTITTTTTAIPIADGTKISSTFPTWVMLGAVGSYNGYELVRVCSATAGTPPAETLNVCYDGRGLSSNWAAQQFSYANLAPATAWASGTAVSDLRIQGTGTQFHLDTVKPLAEAGVPGPLSCITTCGRAATTGTVSLASNSNIMTWASGPVFTSAIVGTSVLFTGTNYGGTPTFFNMWRQIVGFTDATHVTLDHAAPTMNAYTGAYQLTDTPGTSTAIFPDLEFPAPSDGHIVRVLYPIFGCESDTACFGVAAHEIEAYDYDPTITGQKYSWQLGYGAGGAFGPNFYGTSLALRNMYLRSGYTPAFNLANFMDEYYIQSPEIGEGYAGAFVFESGGIPIGAMADYLTNPSTVLHPANFENFALNGITETLQINVGSVGSLLPNNCNTDDTRDQGINADWLTQAALWDPHTGTGTLGAGVGSSSTGGTVTGWTVTGLTPPFLALITTTGTSDTQYEMIRVTSIVGTTWTWTPAWFPFFSAAHSSGAQIVAGAAMFNIFLAKFDARDQICRRNPSDGYPANEQYSFSNAYPFASNGPSSLATLTLTMGSPNAVRSGVTTTCDGVNIGTLALTSSTTAVLQGASVVGQPTTGPANQRIMIWDGTSLASLAYVATAYATTGATLTFSGSVVDTTTGTALVCTTGTPCSYMVTNTGNFTTIGQTNTWPQTDTLANNAILTKNWACVNVDATHVILNRPWDQTWTTGYMDVPYAVQGHYQQPFMAGGYKEIGMRWAQHSSNPTVAADYLLMSQQTGTWSRNYGWDYTNSKGIFYVAIAQLCADPTLAFNSAFSLLPNLISASTLHGGDGGAVQGCGPTGNNIATSVARSQNTEMGSGMIQYFNVNPSTNKSVVDAFMGATWGAAQPYGANAGCATSVASTCDGLDAANCELSGMAGYKWPGFCFGIGGFFSTSYPAVRLSSQPSFNPVPVFSGRWVLSGQGVLFRKQPETKWPDFGPLNTWWPDLSRP